MDTSTHYIDSPPLSVQEIARKAEDFDYNPLVPLRHWLRTAETLLKEVRSPALLVVVVKRGRRGKTRERGIDLHRERE